MTAGNDLDSLDRDLCDVRNASTKGRHLTVDSDRNRKPNIDIGNACDL